jgi:hypothetical protein
LKWIFSILTVLLVCAWFLRWTEIETSTTTTPGVEFSYKKDNWSREIWLSFFSPMAMNTKPTEIPLGYDTKRFDSLEVVVKELEKHGRSGYLADAWRKRDLVTYIWINLTLFSIIGTIISFVKNKRQKKDIVNDYT